jgi:hypothetical protein
MTLTNYPQGVSSFGIPVIGSGGDVPVSTGNHFFVHSGTGSNGNPGNSPTQPLATIDYAIGLCTANKGDVIVVMPGHAETIAAAAGIAADVAGISIIGLGVGTNKPTISFSATDSTFTVSAANIYIANLRVTSTVDEVVKMFHVTAAYVTLDNIEHFETASCQTIQFLLTTNAADFLTVKNCYHFQANAATAAQLWIQLVGCDNVRILDNVFILALQNGATCAVINATTAVANCEIARNTIKQTGGTTQVSAILLVTASTGFVHDNRVAAAVTTLAGTVALASAYGAENYTVNTVNTSGILDPVADT